VFLGEAPLLTETIFRRTMVQGYRLIWLLLLPSAIMIWMTGKSRLIPAMIGADAFVPLLIHAGRDRKLQSSSLSSTPVSSHAETPPTSIGIVGGGLAGLSTAYHLLQKSPTLNITILDKALPGFGGASSVAGGYVLFVCLISYMFHAYIHYQSRMNQLFATPHRAWLMTTNHNTTKIAETSTQPNCRTIPFLSCLFLTPSSTVCLF
jgi:hypothetical protein